MEVDEDSAYVKLTLISKDYPRFEEMLALGVDDMEETYAKRNISSEDYKEKYGQLVMECIDGVDVISRKSIEINYVKDGNTWRPDSEIFYLVMGALVLPEGE